MNEGCSRRNKLTLKPKEGLLFDFRQASCLHLLLAGAGGLRGGQENAIDRVTLSNTVINHSSKS